MTDRRLPIVFALAALVGCSQSFDQAELQPVELGMRGASTEQLRPLARAIGDRRIVLLGENGHGVGELTTAKVGLVRWLHEELGFDVVVMESGFFECGQAWRRADDAEPPDLLRACLRYPFEQAEILPLFELVRNDAGSDRPLELAGMDPQPQGFDSGERPRALHSVLQRHDRALARRVAAYDSALFLVPDSGGLGPEVYPWILERGSEVRAAYDSAAALTTGRERWAFRLAAGLVDRLGVRAEAVGRGAAETPAAYYELRDEWMARAVAAIADSISGPRKVAVWLHNDHARYGDFESAGGGVRSVGGFLREWYGDELFSVGFFMGRGAVADNSRRRREIRAPDERGLERYLGASGHDAGYLVLSGNANPEVRAWASRPQPYLRMGLEPRELVPADEFDALFYVDRVGPPDYGIPGTR